MQIRLSILLTLFTLTSSLFNSCQPDIADARIPQIDSPRETARATIRRKVFSIIRPPVNQTTLTWDVTKGPASGVSFADDGTVTMMGPQEIIVRSRQTLSTDFTLEVTIPPDFGKTQHLPYIGLDPYPPSPTSPTLWGINSLTNAIRLDSQSAYYSASAGDRIIMEGKQGVIRYYKKPLGATTATLLYVSQLPPIQPGTSFPITMVKLGGGVTGDQTIAMKATLTIN